MSRYLYEYRDAIRALREAGYDSFSANNGYYLSGNLSAGQKAAITRAENNLFAEREERYEERPEREPQVEYGDYYADAYGDADESWADIDYFDFEEVEDFADEEEDSYEET